MNSAIANISLFDSLRARFAEISDSNPVLKPYIEKNFQNFLAKGFPTIKNEEWKYTDLQKILNRNYSLRSSSPTQSISPKAFLQNALHISFVNSAFNTDNLALSKNISIQPLSQTTQERLDKYFSIHQNALAQLNSAMAENALLITIKKNTHLQEPILVTYTISPDSPCMVFPRLLVVMEENTSASFIESFSADGLHASLIVSSTEFYLQQNANLIHYLLQLDLQQSSHISHTAIFHEQKSNSSTTVFTGSGELVRNNLLIDLLSQYSETTLYGLYFGNKTSHIDNHTTVRHAVSNSLSNELYKGIINDEASAVFNGKIIVQPDAQKTNAFQSNKNILLSPNATVNAKPQLEIFANDVKCSHGATTGRLDEEALFYLRSRGIDKIQAQAILVKAFAHEIIENVHLPELQTYLAEHFQN